MGSLLIIFKHYRPRRMLHPGFKNKIMKILIFILLLSVCSCGFDTGDCTGEVVKFTIVYRHISGREITTAKWLQAPVSNYYGSVQSNGTYEGLIEHGCSNRITRIAGCTDILMVKPDSILHK